MRQTFETFGGLYGYYLYLKAHLEGSGTLLPQKVRCSIDAITVKSSREEKHCFVADVENAIRSVEPEEYRIALRLYYEGGPEITYAWIARRFRKEKGPRQLWHRQNVVRAVREARAAASGYLKAKGYLA